MNLDELDITFLNEGITHIEELPVDDFLSAVRNLNMYEVSEKVDGANLIFGLDEKSNFYTSREGKGGQRYYDYRNWGDKFWQTGFKSAHVALEQVAKQVLNPMDAVEVEILFGELPNAVPYSGEVNQIIFLRPVAGDPDIQKIANQLDEHTVNVSIDDVPYTNDGKTIQHRNEKHLWQFAKVPNIPSDSLSKEEAKAEIEEKLLKLEQLIKQKIKVGNATMPIIEVLAIKLNKRPEQINQADWQEAKTEIKAAKEEIGAKIRNIQLDIKDVLLNELVRNVQSAFGPKLDNDGWIEGVVLRHKDNGSMIKVVDKSIFTAINKFNHMIRGQIADSRNSESIKQALTRGLADTIGHPTLASTSAKRYLKKFGANSTEILKNLGSQINFNEAKPKFERILSTAATNLDKLRNEYQSTKNKLSTTVDFGKHGEREFNYQGEINKRTLQAFAELEKDIKSAQVATAQATSGADLLNILIGNKLPQFGESAIMEGGHAVPNVGAIAKEEIRPTLVDLAQAIGVPSAMLSSNALGSVGKTEISGDLDIALDAATYNWEDIKEKAENAVGSENVKYMPQSKILSISFPIAHYDETIKINAERTGRVQVDLMFGKPNWLKFSYHSAGDKSKYKGVYRTLLISAVASSLGQVMMNKEGEITGRFAPGLLLYSGIQIRGKKRKVNKQGKLLKGEETLTPQEFKKQFPDADIDRYGKKFHLDDPNEVAKLLFGHVKPNINLQDLDSFESVFDLVKKMPTEQQKIIKDVFTQRLTMSKLPIPPEINNN